MQFVNFYFGLLEAFPASRCDRINSPPTSANIFQLRPKKSAALQSVQERIEGPRTDAVPVMPQLLHHGQSEDRLVGSMNQDVYPN
jgi:hypothetical protein